GSNQSKYRVVDDDGKNGSPSDGDNTKKPDAITKKPSEHNVGGDVNGGGNAGGTGGIVNSNATNRGTTNASIINGGTEGVETLPPSTVQAPTDPGWQEFNQIEVDKAKQRELDTVESDKQSQAMLDSLCANVPSQIKSIFRTFVVGQLGIQKVDDPASVEGQITAEQNFRRLKSVDRKKLQNDFVSKRLDDFFAIDFTGDPRWADRYAGRKAVWSALVSRKPDWPAVAFFDAIKDTASMRSLVVDAVLPQSLAKTSLGQRFREEFAKALAKKSSGQSVEDILNYASSPQSQRAMMLDAAANTMASIGKVDAASAKTAIENWLNRSADYPGNESLRWEEDIRRLKDLNFGRKGTQATVYQTLIADAKSVAGGTPPTSSSTPPVEPNSSSADQDNDVATEGSRNKTVINPSVRDPLIDHNNTFELVFDPQSWQAKLNLRGENAHLDFDSSGNELVNLYVNKLTPVARAAYDKWKR
ncbi:MAG: hypothetical protein ACRDAM_02530, partial [Casimicrobium sp.]